MAKHVASARRHLPDATARVRIESDWLDWFGRVLGRRGREAGGNALAQIGGCRRPLCWQENQNPGGGPGPAGRGRPPPRPAGVRDAIIARRPPYSPGLNPIERAFATLKALLRKAGARTQQAFSITIGSLLDAFSPRERRNCLTSSGHEME